MADRGRPIPIGAAIYASAHKAVQPPDDRTYSAEVTVFQRNLPHHRSARAVFPYTRSIMIPPRKPNVKQNFRENHKVCILFSYNLQYPLFADFGSIFATAAIRPYAPYGYFPSGPQINCAYSAMLFFSGESPQTMRYGHWWLSNILWAPRQELLSDIVLSLIIRMSLRTSDRCHWCGNP